MTLRSIFGLFVISLTLPLLAQENPAPVGEKAGPAVKALILTHGAVNLEVFTVAGDKISEPFNVGSSGLSDNFYPGKSFNLAIKDPAAENGARLVSAITLPDGAREFVVLLEPTAEKLFKPHILNSQNKDFRENSILFFNTSSQPIGVKMDEKNAVIPPKKIQIIAAPSQKGDIPYYDAALFYPKGTKTRMFASSRWLHRPDGRSYVFVYQDSKSGAFKSRILSELLLGSSQSAN